MEGTWGSEDDKEKEHCKPNEVDGTLVGGACCDCPAGATCKAGTTKDSITIKEGYYRHSRTTAQILECRQPKGCAGTSTDPESDDVEDMRLEGDELCRAGFTGEKLGLGSGSARLGLGFGSAHVPSTGSLCNRRSLLYSSACMMSQRNPPSPPPPRPQVRCAAGAVTTITSTESTRSVWPATVKRPPSNQKARAS